MLEAPLFDLDWELELRLVLADRVELELEFEIELGVELVVELELGLALELGPESTDHLCCHGLSDLGPVFSLHCLP